MTTVTHGKRDVISKVFKGFYSQIGLLFIRAVTLKVDGPDMRVKWWNTFDELEEVRK